MRLRPLLAFTTVIVAGACSGHDDTSRAADRGQTTPAAERASQWAAALLDSASTAAAAGDTAAAQALLGKAGVLAAGNAGLVYRIALTQERLGDDARAARGFRRYLSLAPEGADALAARDRLAHLIAGGGTVTRLAAAGETVRRETPHGSAPVASAQADGSHPTRRVSALPSATARSRAFTSRRLALVPSRPSTVAPPASIARAEPALPRTGDDAAIVGASIAVAMPADRSSTSTVASQAPDVRETSRVASTPVEGVDGVDLASASLPKIHYSRWSRMQLWFVGKVAALGGTGGAIVGGIIGNIPGAIALGAAGGAAGGLAKVHEVKVDSARAIAALHVAGRLVRDSSAGEVARSAAADSGAVAAGRQPLLLPRAP